MFSWTSLLHRHVLFLVSKHLSPDQSCHTEAQRKPIEQEMCQEEQTDPVQHTRYALEVPTLSLQKPLLFIYMYEDMYREESHIVGLQSPQGIQNDTFNSIQN